MWGYGLAVFVVLDGSYLGDRIVLRLVTISVYQEKKERNQGPVKGIKQIFEYHCLMQILLSLFSDIALDLISLKCQIVPWTSMLDYFWYC